jgi:diadenosine tetraphosphatase ApaH/serine/threonine PP2A family protein phosphatase
VDNHSSRISRYSGTPYEIGLAAGQKLGHKLEQNIYRYLAFMEPYVDTTRLHEGALPWLRSLPQRFLEEFEGLSAGSGLSLQRLAEWSFVEECEKRQCSGAVYLQNGKAWVARNNDAFVPELWGYVDIREIDGRIPWMNFSMEGDVFSPTGINQEKLWLHYNFLSVWDKPSLKKPHFPCYVFLPEALERCCTIAGVEQMLNEYDRDGGMLLFAVDGKTNECALFDCLCSSYARREVPGSWIVGTNHFCTCPDQTLTEADGPSHHLSTVSRFNRMESMLSSLPASPQLPGDLIRILADDQIERCGPKIYTVYSNVACPATGEIWYTFGGSPAGSRGDWGQVPWPW